MMITFVKVRFQKGNSHMLFAIVISVLALIGFGLSVIFYAVDHNKLLGLRKYTGFICDETVCKSVLILDDASLFWIKNYYLGGLYFAAIFLFAIMFLLTGNLFFSTLIVIISLISLYNAVYLFLRLIYVHKINCVFCFSGQFLVLLILILGLV